MKLFRKISSWLLLAMVLYLIALGAMSSLRHYNFQTQTWDLGAFVQTFWNTSHGRIMQNNLEEVRNHFGVHMSPFLLLLAPGYVVFQTPYYLLIIQTLALALGAWPLYLLARRVLQNERISLLVAVGYLLYPPLQWVNLFDFHEIAFFVPLMLAALCFIEAENWKLAAFFLALSASVEENAVLAVLFAGIYLIVRKKFKAGFWTTGLSMLFFVLAIKVFMPAAGGGLLRLDRYSHLGGNIPEILQNFITHPKLFWDTVFVGPKMLYVFWLLVPIGFLPLLSGRAWILLIPGLLQNLLTLFEFQFSSFYQYDAILIPGLWAGVVFGLKFLLDRWPGASRIFAAGFVFAVLLGFFFRSPLNPVGFPVALFRSSPHWDAFRQMLKLVPPEASVAAQTNLVPHLAEREHIYNLGREPFLADAVLVDLGDYFGFRGHEEFQSYLESYLATGDYEIKFVDEQNRYAVFLRKPPGL